MQVSRLGMPLVNEVVVPIGFKDYFNGSNPRGDAAYLPKVNDPELPHLINAVYGTASPRSRTRTPGWTACSGPTWCRSSSPVCPG